ncbi:complement component C1q receptor [Fundulus heteroclitus]|uniref:complement component C1q receptor n=1 Tax=Fundulus heteroclitus TaxID=8078 RepID=UPI00165B1B7C|nr:complement component C1q receptor [Fundulus heteroclitus]
MAGTTPLSIRLKLWTAPDLLLVMGATELMVLLALLGGLQESSGAQQEMLCTPNACFVLHMEPVRFHKAQNRCEDDGGYLLTVRASDEQEDLLSLLSLIEEQQGEPALRFWIGLKLSRGECVRPDRTLRGFRWISGGEDSQFSNWKREPVSTCTEERCVTVDYSFSGQEQLRWTPAGCRMKASYVCKFYFQGMCEALTLLGSGKIIYEAVFSKHPLKSELELLPFGTRARIFCGAQELATSLCRSEDGAYSWTDPGPFCKPGSRSCARSNGGCEHECRQEGEAVLCSCREGYELDGDGFSCRREDLCRAAACQHRCVTEETGFSCKCPSGFQLKENRRDCSDVDECREQACGDHGCINTDGGYRCECRPGYLLSHGECRDVDECETSPCEQRCTNNMGSFSCSCSEGFRLSEDGRSCFSTQPLDTQGTATAATPTAATAATATAATAATPTAATATAAPAQDRFPSPDDSEAWGLLEGLGRTTAGLQDLPPHTAAPPPALLNATDGEQHANGSSVLAAAARSRVLICVLGSLVPLLALVALTLCIAIFRCSRGKKQEKKKSTADGYCWVSSGLDPRLEKLYESILTDDL